MGVAVMVVMDGGLGRREAKMRRLGLAAASFGVSQASNRKWEEDGGEKEEGSGGSQAGEEEDEGGLNGGWKEAIDRRWRRRRW